MSIFVDTNILMYAHDTQAGERHRIASEKVSQLWARNAAPSLSIQVLQELYVNLVKGKMPHDEARRTVEDYMAWNVVINDAALLVKAMNCKQRWRISLWDALIVEAARRAGATELWTEDLNTGQDFDGVLVVNPLV